MRKWIVILFRVNKPLKWIRLFWVILLLAILLQSCSRQLPVGTPSVPTPTSISTPATNKIPEMGPGISLPESSISLLGVARFEHVSIEDGLSESVVNCMLQDSKGFMWFGTQDGLNRYDGYTFTIFRPNLDEPNSLSDRWITALHEDAHGNLWIGTRNGGLNKLDLQTGTISHIFHDSGNKASLISNNIRALEIDTTGVIWVGTSNGLDRLNPETGAITHFTHIAGDSTTISSNSILALHQDQKGYLWVGSSDAGLDRGNLLDMVFIHYRNIPGTSDTLVNDTVRAIVEDGMGRLWLATSDGLSKYDPANKHFIKFTHNPTNTNSLVNDTILSIYLDSVGDLWIGTAFGIDRYRDKTGQFIHYHHNPGDSESLSGDVILSIFEDAGGVMWIGTYGNGLNRFSRNNEQFVTFQHDPENPNSLSHNLIFPIYIDHVSQTWIGTYGGGLNKFDRAEETFTSYVNDPQNTNSLMSDFVTALYGGSKNILWVGTLFGLDRFDTAYNVFTHFKHDENDPGSISDGEVTSIYEDFSGNLWVGTTTGLSLFNSTTNSFAHFKHNPNDPKSISNDGINAIYQDKDQQIWISTSFGLSRIDPRSMIASNYYYDVSNPHSLSNNSINSTYQDQAGNLWIATAGGGLNRYDPGTDSFEHYLVKDGLPSDVIYGILEDQSGNLWLSTNTGISKFDPKTKYFQNYSVSDGLQSNEFNARAYALSSNGEMYFGGVNGFTLFNPEFIKDSTYLPPVVLTSLTSEGKPVPVEITVPYLNAFTLRWPNNSFEFEFSVLGYAEPQKNQYAYMLANFDKEWYLNGNKRDGRYTNLQGGTYTLLLKGSNSDGVWSKEVISIKVIVIPPFWATWGFRIALIVSVVGLALLIFWLRIRTAQNRNRELEKVVQERTQQIQQRNQEMEALYRADEKMYRYLNIDQALQALVDVAVDILSADRSAVFLWSDEQNRWSMKVCRGYKPSSQRTLTFEKNEGAIGRVIKSRKPVVIQDTVVDAKWKNERIKVVKTFVGEEVHSLLLLPVMINHEIFGVFNICFKNSHAFNPNILRLFQALAQRAALSIENAILFEQTKDLAVVEERTRLAHDLHDSAKQKAFAAMAQLSTAREIVKNDPPAATEHMNEAEDLVYDVIQELTFLIQEMYPLAFQEKGLEGALREYIFEWENRNDIRAELTVMHAMQLPLSMEQALFRITQETLANVARHSKATWVELRLEYQPETVKMIIKDNGIGFDPTSKAKGVGLRSLNERAKSLNGKLEIISAHGNGTTIIVIAPISKKRNSR